jgi:cellulose synthase/poly-beta-1,6-N-acetylglucosamine synthase-like glycosyltransferase/exo-beta-1,3-glucanase (GH17 family)
MLLCNIASVESRGRVRVSAFSPIWFESMRLAAAVITLIACVHAGLWALNGAQRTATNISGPLASVSYDRVGATADQIRADLKAIAPYTRAIRTYSTSETKGLNLVPAIADEVGLKVTVGAWIEREETCDEKDPACLERRRDEIARNESEMAKAVKLAKDHRNVIGIVVGNETLFRGDMTVKQIVKYIQRVKREVQVPVTTADTLGSWLDDSKINHDNNEEHPWLASNVDYIAVHILPYWNHASEKNAVEEAISGYEKLRQVYPGKRIVIAEFGWPSAGYNYGDANPGRVQQAAVLHDFVSRAEALAIDYNIVDAFDQPSKATYEGNVGPYWGLMDTARQPKLVLVGIDADHWKIAAIAVLIGFLLSLPILRLAGATLGQAVLLTMAVHMIGAWCANVFAYWTGHYFVPGAAFAFALGLVLLAILIAIGIARVEEIAAIAFGQKPQRLLRPATGLDGYAPKVSIHIPACREPPEMLKLTLDSVARLDYPNLECVVVVNNTPDPGMWQPVEEHCRLLGERFKFVHAEELRGFKAGALRLAIVHTAADAEIIGVIDADYTVDPNWLKELLPAFADPTLGLIQAPQDHRDGDRSVMHQAMNGEYAGFFNTGMVQRNENNAIIVHGTMCLIRRTALEAVGGWSSDTICEDTDLGLMILEHGWQIQYTNRRYGFGLLPNSFEAFKKQRYRWASGGAQILKKHWRQFKPGASLLTPEQKRDFIVGWLNWLGAESVGVAVALLNIGWVPFIAFAKIAIPDKILTLPIMAAFVVSLVHFATVYRMRVPIPVGQMLSAMFAAMSVQWTVARAVGYGLIKRRLPFVRTAKGGGSRRNQAFQAFWEAAIGGLLVVGSVILVATNREQVREIYIFAVVLLVQSVPFMSAVAIALLENSRINDFAYWRGLEVRLAELLPRRAVIAEAPVPTADERVETAP